MPAILYILDLGSRHFPKVDFSFLLAACAFPSPVVEDNTLHPECVQSSENIMRKSTENLQGRETVQRTITHYTPKYTTLDNVNSNLKGMKKIKRNIVFPIMAFKKNKLDINLQKFLLLSTSTVESLHTNQHPSTNTVLNLNIIFGIS